MRLRIVNDDCQDSPRAWDNMGTMACWHSRYTLGDEQPTEDPQEYIAALPKDSLVLPLYLYDHSGITMNTTGFSCGWDSGQVGIIYVTPEGIKAEGITREQAEANLRSEVEVYDLFIRGAVYGFIVEQEIGRDECGHSEWEQTDSCFGFYGEDWENNGMKEHLPVEVLPQLENVEVEYS